jgi:hypothetical protein
MVSLDGNTPRPSAVRPILGMAYLWETTMRKLGKFGAEAGPIAMEGQGSQRILLKVIVESDHPLGHGRLHLSADQALYVHARLTQIAAAFLHADHGGWRSTAHAEPARRDEEPVVRLGRYGAEAWPLVSDGGDGCAVLNAVLIESVHPDGHGVVRLSPEQAIYIRDRLEQISISQLHENVWGGEDARLQ